MSIISASGSLVRTPREDIREERAVLTDKHCIDMHGRDIALLISSSCSPSSRVPLERTVSKVLITAANAMQALGHLEYQGDGVVEFKHTHRTIGSSPLKAIQDDIFAREVDREVHCREIATEVSGALEIIREKYYENNEIIFSALGGFVKVKEDELSSFLLQPSLNLKKVRQIETELKHLLDAIEVLSSSDGDVNYQQNLITKRLEGLLKYVQSILIIAEVEKFELSTPGDFERFFDLTRTFENQLYDWNIISRSIQSNPSAVDYSFHADGLSFARKLSKVCVDKFSSRFSFFSSIVERMKELIERKHLAVFSENAGAAQEDMEALDSAFFDLDKLLGKAKKFLTQFSGLKPNTQTQLVIIARDIKKYLINPLVQIKRELRDCCDLDSAAILLELKESCVRAVVSHKALKEQHALIEGDAEVVALCAFLESTSQNLVEIIDQKLSQVVDSTIAQNMSEMNAFLEEKEKDSDWEERMEEFCDQLLEFLNHRFCSSLPEALKKRIGTEIGRIYWRCHFTILEESEAPETIHDMVDFLEKNEELFQTYTREFEAVGGIDSELDSYIRASYFRRIDQLLEQIMSLLQRDVQMFGDRALYYAQKEVSVSLAYEVTEIDTQYNIFTQHASSLLERVGKGDDALNIELSHISSIFSLMLMECWFHFYSEDPEKFVDNFLSQKKIFHKLQTKVLAEGSFSQYQAQLKGKLVGVEAFIRREVESYLEIFTGSATGLLDEIDSCLDYAEPARMAAFHDLYKKIQVVDEQCGKFACESAFVSEKTEHLRLCIQTLKMRFQQSSLAGVREHLKAFEDSIMSELIKSPKEQDFYRERIEAFYCEFIIPKFFGEEGYSPEAIYLFKEKDVILGKIRNILEGKLRESPARTESADLLSSQVTPVSETFGIVPSPSPSRPISSFPDCS